MPPTSQLLKVARYGLLVVLLWLPIYFTILNHKLNLGKESGVARSDKFVNTDVKLDDGITDEAKRYANVIYTFQVPATSFISFNLSFL